MEQFTQQSGEKPVRCRKRAVAWCRAHPGQVARADYANGTSQLFRLEDRPIHPDYGAVKMLFPEQLRPDESFDADRFQEERFVGWLAMDDEEAIQLCGETPRRYLDALKKATGPAAATRKDALRERGLGHLLEGAGR